MFALRLPPEIESRLDELARRTGRSMSSYAREAIVEKIGELEAAHRPNRTFSIDEVERLVRSRAPGALIRREGDRLIVEKAATTGLTDWLKSIEPWDETFPDVDVGLPPLDQPDISAEVDGNQLKADGAEKASRSASKAQRSPAVQKRWEAGTIKDGRPTLFGEDIEDRSDATLFVVTRKDNPKREGAATRFDWILKGECRTVGDYRKKVGAKRANDDIAWDLNHGFYSLKVPSRRAIG